MFEDTYLKKPWARIMYIRLIHSMRYNNFSMKELKIKVFLGGT